MIATLTPGFSAIPSSTDAPWILREIDTAVTDHEVNIVFGLRADMTTLPGTYTNTVVFTAIANPEPLALIYIQEINQLNCPVDRTMVTDARDYRTYWVQRMPDGRCWMQTNLAYAGGGDNAFGDVVNIINDESASSYTSPNFMRPPAATGIPLASAFPTMPNTSTSGIGQYGYLYNWCAAMGNQQGTSACMMAASPLPDPSISICPAGWRLPIGSGDAAAGWFAGGELAMLNNAVNGGLNNTDEGLRTQWLGVYGGNTWGGGNFWGTGTSGAYWASTHTAGSTWEAHRLDFSAASVSISSSQRTDGRAVRCIAEPVYIQEVNENNCPEERTMVVDARDNRTYWVQQMSDGRCWMQTNLAYAGGGDNRFGDTIELFNEETVGDASSPNFMRPPAATASIPIATTFPASPDTSTFGIGQYGYLYNWCAAMGGQYEACFEFANPLPDPSISICPAGWRLPTSGWGGDFDSLNNAVNSGATDTDVGLRTQWLGTYGGRWWISGFPEFFGTGSWGYYWSSDPDQWNAMGLYFDSGQVSDTSVDRAEGVSVRCIAEPLPERIYIQEINDLNCPTARTMVVDARDNRTYWVQRMPDGRCWMQTNLAYAGGGNNTFGDVVALTNSSAQNATAPNFTRPTDANPTTFPTQPSTATDGGMNVATRQFGYLYNWCAAMGGQSNACITSSMDPVDTTISVCPAGWRLPTAGSDGATVQNNTTNEFWNLNQVVNSGLTNTDAGWRAQWLSMYGGTIQGSAGVWGFYWSSTRGSTWGARALSLGASSVTPAPTGNVDRWNQISVRCIAEPTSMQEITLSTCPTERTIVVDARDNRSYWIQRIGSDCWMLTNLAYAGGGNNRFGDVIYLYDGELNDNSSASPNFLIPPGADPTTFPEEPSIDMGGSGQFGYLYNWCAAMGGQDGACGSLMYPIDPSHSICPLGWRLPEDNTMWAQLFEQRSDFSNLVSSVGGTEPGLRHQWLGVFGGNATSAGFGQVQFQGQWSFGSYWSSSAQSDGPGWFNIATFEFQPGWFNITTYTQLDASAVRCML